MLSDSIAALRDTWQEERAPKLAHFCMLAGPEDALSAREQELMRREAELLARERQVTVRARRRVLKAGAGALDSCAGAAHAQIKRRRPRLVSL